MSRKLFLWMKPIVEVSFTNKKMQKNCSNGKAMRKCWGDVARRLQQRLMELIAATTLEDIGRTRSSRCHELKGNRKGQLSVDLDHPYRLIFKPDHHPIPRKEDGGLDWGRVTEIVVIEVVDTH